MSNDKIIGWYVYCRVCEEFIEFVKIGEEGKKTCPNECKVLMEIPKYSSIITNLKE